MLQTSTMIFASLFVILLTIKNSVQDVYNYNTHPEVILNITEGDQTRISGVQDRTEKDIILGGLFTIHNDAAGSGGGKCGETVWNTGVETLEAFFYAIDTINKDPNLLPNITLGYDVRDTCQSENIALDESVDLILSGGRIETESCQISQSSSASNIPVAATIGPLESFVSIPVASFFRLFQMPQVSYASSSSLLSNRDRYGYFFRTVPPDDLQAQAIIDIILYNNWDHVSTVYSDDVYGQPLNSEFHRLAEDNGICIDLNLPIDEEFNPSQYKNLAQKLLNTTANVVILLAAVDHSEMFINEIQEVRKEKNSKKNFFWITSDASTDSVSKFPDVTAGMWGIVPSTNQNSSFNDSYLSDLLPTNNKRNPWFIEYYENIYDCTFGINCSNVSVASHPSYRPFFPLISLVIDAVYSVAHAIDAFIHENCQQPTIWFSSNQTCAGQNMTFNGQNILSYLYQVNFTSPTGNKIRFNEEGHVEGKFNILNLQKCQNCTREYNLEQICYWDESQVNRLNCHNTSQAQYGVDLNTNEILYDFKSQCQECKPGFVKRQIATSCCGICDPCLGQNYTNLTSSVKCEPCPKRKWGDSPLSGSSRCVDVQESYLRISDPWSIVLILTAVLGLLFVVFVAFAFIWFRNTPIIKSSGREQMALILIGTSLCFLITPVYLIRPSIVICTFQRVGLWFCFSLILSALLVKLVRISRIFMHKKITSRPLFISSKYQILFTFILVGIQMVLVLISLVVVYPTVKKSLTNNENNHNDFPSLIIQCTTPHPALIVILMIYYSILIIASNVIAILTIRFPQNFNESRYVAFSTFSLGIMWIAFVFTYLNTSDKFQTAVISFTIQMSGMAVLLCLFAPRIFILLILPKFKTVDGTTIDSGPSNFIKPKIGSTNDSVPTSATKA